jgi:hypothetical protein
MSATIKCEYCNKNIIKRNVLRHQNSKECRNTQQNKDINIKLKEYKCKYCETIFNRIDKQNTHELICMSKDMYYKFQIELEKKNKELELKNNEINIYKEENLFLKSQLQTYRPNINCHVNSNNSNNTNITINNNININFSDIQNHLDKFNIHVLSDRSSLINFIMNVFSNKVKLTNECKQIMSYYLNDKLVNDIKCKTFLSNSAGQLTEISDKICQDGKSNKSLNDTVVKSACLNNILLNNMSTEEGIKNGIRKKNPMILVHEIIRYLKENNLTEIRGV